MLSNLVDTQVKKKKNRGLKTEEFIMEKYITYKYKRACNLRRCAYYSKSARDFLMSLEYQLFPIKQV